MRIIKNIKPSGFIFNQKLNFYVQSEVMIMDYNKNPDEDNFMDKFIFKTLVKGEFSQYPFNVECVRWSLDKKYYYQMTEYCNTGIFILYNPINSNKDELYTWAFIMGYYEEELKELNIELLASRKPGYKANITPAFGVKLQIMLIELNKAESVRIRNVEKETIPYYTKLGYQIEMVHDTGSVHLVKIVTDEWMKWIKSYSDRKLDIFKTYVTENNKQRKIFMSA